jgi:polysaccharide biosynthesis transport protein
VKTDDLLPVLWRRRTTFAVTFLAVLATVAVVTSQLPKTYFATSYLLVTPSRPAATDYETAQVSETLTKTYGQLLGTQNVAEQVQRRLGPEVAEGDVGSRIAIDTGDTQLVGITAAGADGREAQLVANTYADVFRERSGRFARQTAAAADIAVAEYATEPLQPSRPRPRLYLLVGALLAALAGAGVALLRHRLDQRLDVSDTDTEIFDVPIVGRIPDRRPTAAGGADEAFRLLLANLAFVNQGERPSTLSVVSAGEQEGKSSTALSLARAAGETGLETLVVDADLRRPSILKKLGLPPAASPGGLSSFLVRSTLSLTEAAVDVPGQDHLQVIPSGPLPPNPAGLLASGMLAEFDGRARRAYQLVVYDTPPLSIAADASLVASQSEGVILVIDVRKTPRKAVVQAVDQLRRARVNLLGIVLNRVQDLEDAAQYYLPVEDDDDGRPSRSSRELQPSRR